MLLLAGMLGIVASGLLWVESGAKDTADAEADTRVSGDDSSDEATRDLLDELSEADDPPAAPSPSEQASAEDDPEVADDPAAVLRDQVAGDYLTDQIDGSTGPVIRHDEDAMFGNVGDDSIVGGSDPDLILGNGGNDTISGGLERDGLYGGDGQDSLSGGDDDDILYGDLGSDRLDGDAGDDLLVGGDGDDTLAGGAGADRLFGMLGEDIMLGHGGDDLLDGTYGLDGRSFADVDSADVLDGGDGNDTLAGGVGDTLTGGAGADTYLFRAPSAGAFENDFPGKSGAKTFITDFDAAEDVIEILYDTSYEPTPGMPPVLDLVDSDAGTEVHLNGTAVALLAPGTQIALRDIMLVSAG